MFSEAPGAIPDLVNHAQYLQEIYFKADPKYTGRVTVPVLWDKRSSTIVNNESREIMRMFDVEFAPLATQKIDLYPRDLQHKIDETINAIYLPINAGVYRAGFATSQAAYEDAVTKLFESLDRWESDFKCNLRRIIDYPNLWNYLKDLYQRPQFKATCNLDYTKRAYYMSMTEINPNRIVPTGPIIDFDELHDRDRFGNA